MLTGIIWCREFNLCQVIQKQTTAYCSGLVLQTMNKYIRCPNDLERERAWMTTPYSQGHYLNRHFLKVIDVSEKLQYRKRSDKNKYVKTDFNNSTDNNYNTQSQKDDHPEGSEVKKVVLKTINMMILPNIFNADEKKYIRGGAEKFSSRPKSRFTQQRIK